MLYHLGRNHVQGFYQTICQLQPRFKKEKDPLVTSFRVVLTARPRLEDMTTFNYKIRLITGVALDLSPARNRAVIVVLSAVRCWLSCPGVGSYNVSVVVRQPASVRQYLYRFPSNVTELGDCLPAPLSLPHAECLMPRRLFDSALSSSGFVQR